MNCNYNDNISKEQRQFLFWRPNAVGLKIMIHKPKVSFSICQKLTEVAERHETTTVYNFPRKKPVYWSDIMSICILWAWLHCLMPWLWFWFDLINDQQGCAIYTRNFKSLTAVYRIVRTQKILCIQTGLNTCLIRCDATEMMLQGMHKGTDKSI